MNTFTLSASSFDDANTVPLHGSNEIVNVEDGVVAVALPVRDAVWLETVAARDAVTVCDTATFEIDADVVVELCLV